MDLHSPSFSDKTRLISRNDSTLQKDDLPHFSSDVNESTDPMVQRCVIIQKDEKGYGLTVSGDNPVFVQSVKEDGAAARAGVQQGDRIIKVNGTLVTQSNHQAVVELIKSGSYVALTLLGKPPGQGKATLSPQHSFHVSGNNTTMNILNSSKSDASDRITGPQPVDPEKQQQLTNSRIHTIRKMLEKEVVYLENLKSEFSKTPSEKMRAEVNGAMKRVKTLEDRLMSLTNIPHEHIVTRSPKSPTSGRHIHDRESYRSVSFPAHGGQNRSLTHQISAPMLPANQGNTNPFLTESGDEKYQVILSPCTNSPEKKEGVLSPDSLKPSISTSLENIVMHTSPRTTTWPQYTHTRQSSSPETLRGIENFKCQKSNGCMRTESLNRSPNAGPAPYGIFKSFSPTSDLKPLLVTSIGEHDSAIESPDPSLPDTPPEQAEFHKSVEVTEEEPLSSYDEYGTPPDSTSDELGIHPVISKLNQNTNIICMEDDDFSSDTEMGHLEDHGPFYNFWKIVRMPAHLSVFLHYLISNSDPSSLLFYLISEIYEQGTRGEMKKWAYEIHSSFLVPGAPLKVSLVDETILHEIDDVLQNSIDKEDVLRNVFANARGKAKVELNNLLADFRNKRTMGLANIFGPPDYQLEEALSDKNKEMKIIEQLLGPCLENYSEDMEGLDDRTIAKTYAIATILKHYGIKNNPHYVNILEKCPTFVAKEKSILPNWLQRKKMGDVKVMQIRGHYFVPEHYSSVTFCNHCQLIIWGVNFQGYQCQNCEMNIHKSCIKVVEEYCIGAVRHKRTKEKDREKVKKDRRSGLVENFIAKTRKSSQPVPAAIERAKRLNDELNADNGLGSDGHTLKSIDSGGRGTHSKEPSEIVFQNMLNLSESAEKQTTNKKSASSIGRSESFRQTRESKPSFRKRSDPNIPRSKSDVDVDDKHGSGLNESRSSSNSSLSNRSLDSPSNSSEMVHRTPTSVSADSVPPNFAPSCGITSTGGHMSGMTQSSDDSDLEADADPPKWQENVDWDVLKVMKPKEKKRQDVINELFHTERTHVRNLKVLDKVFYKPLVQEQLLPPDFLNLLFPNLEEMLEIHTTFNNKMKARRKTEAVIGDIGQLMLEMFDGAAGDHMKQAAATYCKNQSIALESLKVRQKKDQKLAQSLIDAETNNLCRRLQLKDIIASGFQRLTKYPLLLENIVKYTPPDTQELTDMQRAVDCSKEILVHVDSAVKEAENMHRLLDMQKKMDKSSFEKVEHPIVTSFKNLDLTQHKLLLEGPLLWRHSKQKTVEMHLVLMEDILILFQKQDEKYILKFHNTILTSGREDTKVVHSPILRVHNLFTRENATDKKTFFIISSSELHAMYEFVATTASEKRMWCTQIDRSATEQKKRLKSNLEATTPIPEPVIPIETGPEDSEPEAPTKEAEVVPEPTEDPGKDKEPAAPDTNPPASEPEPSPPSIPPDETPQRAKQVGPEDDPNDPSNCRTLKRIERLEILEITEGPQLIEPSEVVISSGAIYETAEPVLTPFEKLRRKDLEIAKAIEEKELITAEILQIPVEDLKKIKEMPDDTKDVTALDLINIAVQQGNKLSYLLNEGLTIEESSPLRNTDEGTEDSSCPPQDKSPSLTPVCKLKGVSLQSLLPVSASLNQCLAQLVVLISNGEEERKQLRKEIASCQEQIHQLHETHRHCITQSQSPSMHSRPSSFVSVASTASDGMTEFFESQHLFSVLEKTEESNSTSPAPPEEPTAEGPHPSSPVPNEEAPPLPERTLDEASDDSENRTCDQSVSASNCDVPDSADVPASESIPEETEATQSRTVPEDQKKKVDPVYL